MWNALFFPQIPSKCLFDTPLPLNYDRRQVIITDVIGKEGEWNTIP